MPCSLTKLDTFISAEDWHTPIKVTRWFHGTDYTKKVLVRSQERKYACMYTSIPTLWEALNVSIHLEI